MAEKDRLLTFSEVVADLERLPELSPARIWLNAIKAIRAEELVTETISGPEEYDSLVWEAMIVIGALSDGKPRFHRYPAGTAVDDLAAIDAALADIDALAGRRDDPAELVALAKRMPSTTFAVLVRAHAETPDGPMVVGLFRHPKVPRGKSVGWLKLTAKFIRDQQAASGGGN